MKLALIGDPVAHSRSPQLHNRFLRDADLEGSYVAIRVPRGSAVQTVRRLREEGYTGLNVTSPLKAEVVAACDELDEDAAMAAAVNTIIFGRKVLGANTDGIGARSAMEAVIGSPVALERIGVLGTGATARAILAQLRETDAYSFVWGRSEAKLTEVCERFEAQPWPSNPPEFVISTLPPHAELPPDLVADLRRAVTVMDVNYGERSTLASALGREVVRGDLMFQAQARASFNLWLSAVELLR
jgi:shikimate dehydrogenase